jgi:hypothetical protein
MAGAFGVAGHIWGDGASVRAATRVNAAQASHEQVAVKWVVSG